MSLMCNDIISSMKLSHIKQHFDMRHAAFASEYPVRDSRKKACQDLLNKVQGSQQQLRLWTQQGERNSAGFAVSVVKVRNGKPFKDGEFAKTFMLNKLFNDFDKSSKS